jgi:hypothetical protein
LRVKVHGGRAENAEQVGDLIVLGSRHVSDGEAAHAVEVSGSAGVRLEDVTLYGSNCFGFWEYHCEGTQYLRCKIDRRAAEDDPVKRGSPRLRSLNADAFHSKHATRGPSYLDCVAHFMGDDAVNINGDYHLVMVAKGRELRVLAKHGMNIEPGDSAELVSYDGRRLPDARVIAVVEAGERTTEEGAFIREQRMDEGLRTNKRSLRAVWMVTLDREVALPRGSVIGAANRMGAGFQVRGCHFGFNRSRGILIKASGGEVSDNILEGSRMSAILVSPEYWWLEAGSSDEVAIRDNVIRDCGGISIRVQAIAGNRGIAPAGAHQKIEVRGNRVFDSVRPGILVTSTSGLAIADNHLEGMRNPERLPDLMRRADLTKLQNIVIIQCEEN